MAYQVNGQLTDVNGRLSYESFNIASREQAVQWWIDQWSTTDQQIYNAMHETCPVCKGRGYAVYRRGNVTVRESVGCQRCLGLGAVPRMQETRHARAVGESHSG